MSGSGHSDGAEPYRGRTEPGARRCAHATRFFGGDAIRALAQTWPLPPGRPSLIGSFELTGPPGDRRSRHVWNNGIHLDRFATSAQDRDSSPERKLPDPRSRQTQPLLRRGQQRNPDRPAVEHRTRSRSRSAPPWSGSTTATRKVTRRGEPIAATCPVFDLTGPENLVPTLLAKAIRTMEVTALDPAGNGWPLPRTEVAPPLAGPRAGCSN